MADQQTTRLGRNWLGKMFIFLAVAVVMGTWGLLDALYFYPQRGLGDSSLRLSKFLQAADEARQLTPDQVAMTDPKARLVELEERKEDLAARAGTGSVDARQAAADFARYQWLDALNKTWVLNREQVAIDVPPAREMQTPMKATHFDIRRGVGVAIDPKGVAPATDVPLNTVLAELKEKWEKTPIPSPLSQYDLFFQWLFVVGGYGCTAWVLYAVAKASRRKYRWEPQTQTLTLPDNRTVTPATLQDIDKRRWHKFFCTLELKDGSTHTCDLLKYQPLEEWVLELERTAFPERAVPDEADEGAEASAEAAQ